MSIQTNKIYNDDCLIGLKNIPDNLYFHFSFMEKEPNFEYKKIKLVIVEQVNYLKVKLIF